MDFIIAEIMFKVKRRRKWRQLQTCPGGRVQFWRIMSAICCDAAGVMLHAG